MGIGVVESSRHLCGHASTISDVIRPKDSTKIKDLALILPVMHDKMKGKV